MDSAGKEFYELYKKVAGGIERIGRFPDECHCNDAEAGRVVLPNGAISFVAEKDRENQSGISADYTAFYAGT